MPVPREHPSSTSNPRGPSSHTCQLPVSSELMGSSRARQLTKYHQNLGACSPRETHLKEPTSAHKLSSYVLLVGTPICPNAGKQVQTSLRQPREENTSSGNQHPLQGQNASSGNQHPLQGEKRLAKLSLNTWSFFPLFAGFVPRTSFLSPMPHGLLAR